MCQKYMYTKTVIIVFAFSVVFDPAVPYVGGAPETQNTSTFR